MTSTTPPGASRRSTVSGSRISTMPVSSSTVVVQMVLEPDMAGYSVGSMMMKPASQSGRVAGTTRFAWQATDPARLAQEQPAQPVALAAQGLHLLEHGRAGRRQHAPGDDVPDLATGVAADDGEGAAGSHRRAYRSSNSAWTGAGPETR